jgi:hypothetical protein
VRYQLRMYRVRPGEMDEWVTEWKEMILPLRRKHGFDVVGAWKIPEDDRFVWIIGHEDFEAADEKYYASPERADLDPDPTRHLANTHSHMMDEVDLDRPA